MVVDKLSNFYRGTTLVFDVAIAINGVPQDLTEDTVEFILSLDGTSVVTVAATVGETLGVASFTVTAVQTDIAPGLYDYEIKWTSGDRVKKTKNTVRVEE